GEAYGISEAEMTRLGFEFRPQGSISENAQFCMWQAGANQRHRVEEDIESFCMTKPACGDQMRPRSGTCVIPVLRKLQDSLSIDWIVDADELFSRHVKGITHLGKHCVGEANNLVRSLVEQAIHQAPDSWPAGLFANHDTRSRRFPGDDPRGTRQEWL